MKRLNVAVIFVILAICCLPLCGCDNCNNPWADKNIPDASAVTFCVYVCGAVRVEGYVEVETGSTYLDAIAQAGLLAQSYLPDFVGSLVVADSVVVVGFAQYGVNYQSVNVNGTYVKHRMPVDGVPFAVINKIADYIDKYGKVTNKEQLKIILGDDYADNYYKFFVAEGDYEAPH